MNTPGFTAEASLDPKDHNYALATGHGAGDGRIVPQWFCIGNFCCQCYGWGFPCRCHVLSEFGPGGIGSVLRA
jgi:hypothetical protein